jgi:hypothetical protein
MYRVDSGMVTPAMAVPVMGTQEEDLRNTAGYGTGLPYRRTLMQFCLTIPHHAARLLRWFRPLAVCLKASPAHWVAPSLQVCVDDGVGGLGAVSVL